MAKALLELSSHKDLASELRDLYISTVKVTTKLLVLLSRGDPMPIPRRPMRSLNVSLLFCFRPKQEIDTSNGKKAAVIFVPFPLHKRFQKVQSRLIRELEKKMSGTHVCFIAQRTIFSKQVLWQPNFLMRLTVCLSPAPPVFSTSVFPRGNSALVPAP